MKLMIQLLVIAILTSILMASESQEELSDRVRRNVAITTLAIHGTPDSVISQIKTLPFLPELDGDRRVCRQGEYLYVSEDYGYIAILDFGPEPVCYQITPLLDERHKK